MNRIVSAIAFVVIGGACAQVKSSNVKTDAILANFQAVIPGDGETNVSASLQVGSDYVTLSSGDVLTASDGSATATLVQSANIFNQTSFTATVDADNPGSTLTVSFTRAGNTSAPNSNVVLPPAFTLSSPLAGATFSRSSDTITLAMSAVPLSNEALTWAASGSCISNAGGSITAGSQSVSVPPGALQSTTTTGSTAQPCTVTFTISAQTTGTVDPAFASGSTITAQEQQSVQITSVP